MTTAWKEQSIQKYTPIRNNFLKPIFKNTPISAINIENWMKYLNIKNFQGVYSRDEVINCTKKGFYVINLDINIGPGTHWVAMNIKPNIIEYFDINCPQEVVHLSNKFGVNYVYNSSHYQDL